MSLFKYFNTEYNLKYFLPCTCIYVCMFKGLIGDYDSRKILIKLKHNLKSYIGILK